MTSTLGAQMETLPDYLRSGLDIAFVRINPSLLSAEVGHYFAHPNNRFWPAVNCSSLLTKPLDAETDHEMLDQGFGFTDVVKGPSNSASKLRAADYRKWGSVLRDKLIRFRSLIVCFHGVTGYRNYLKYTEAIDIRTELGLQEDKIGDSVVFVVPNPSAAKAAYSLDDLVSWYQKQKGFRDRLESDER